MQTYPYGAVLKIQREFDLPTIKGRLDNIKGLGMNFAVIWPAVYWWEDRQSPNYPFQTGHEILKHAEKIGLKIIMELAGQITSLEYAPDFVMKDEYLPVQADGHYEKAQPYYGYLNYNHPEVKQLVHKNYAEAAANYKDYPALYGYDIWNETMFNSHDQHTLRVFQAWLKRKYVTIDALNASWERVFYDWSDVKFSAWMWPSVMPVVDHHQFKKENVGMILKEWGDVIRSVDPKHPLIADNIHSMITSPGFHERPHDDWNVAENVDEYGISFYPKNSTKPMDPLVRWELYTGIHSASRGGRFWVSEMQTHYQALFNPFGCVYPYDLRQWNWEAISHGCKGIIYWMWEPFRKGLQTMGRGLVDIHGNYGARAQEAAGIHKIIRQHEKAFLEYVPSKARVAILYDKLAHDFQKSLSVFYKHLVPDDIYLDSIKGLYQAFWEQNVPVRFIRPEDLIAGRADDCQLIFASSQLNMGDDLANAIKKWTAQGGTLVTDGRFGVIDNLGEVYTDIIPGGKLNPDLGYQFQDIEANDSLVIKGQGVYDGLHAHYERQIMKLRGGNAKVLGSFADGSPAVLESAIGKGKVLAFASYIWFGYLREGHESVRKLVSQIIKDYDLAIHTISDNQIKVCSLEGGDGMIFFAFNYGEAARNAKARLGQLPAGEYQLTQAYAGSTSQVKVGSAGLELEVRLEAQGVELFILKRQA